MGVVNRFHPAVTFRLNGLITVPGLVSRGPCVVLSVGSLQGRRHVFHIKVVNACSIPVEASSPEASTGGTIDERDVIFRRSRRRVFGVRRAIIRVSCYLGYI